MKGFIYILESQRNGRYYIGSTNDLGRRLIEHNGSKTKSLRYLRPLKVVFSQEFATIGEARTWEMRLKRLKSRRLISEIIESQKLMGL